MGITIPDRNTQGEVILAKGVTLEWLDGGKILVFTVSDPKRDTIDVYIEAVLTLIQGWNPAEPVRVMQDISSSEIALTPYFRQRLQEAQHAIAERGLHGVSAVVLKKGFFEQIIVLFGRAMAPKAPAMKTRYFLSREEALAALRDDIK